MSSPKAVFNGKRHFPPPRGVQSSGGGSGGGPIPQDTVTPQHEDNVRFVHDAWTRIQNELYQSNRQGREGIGPVYYTEKDPATNHEFEPVDLEQFIANRMYQNIKQNS